MKGMRGCYNNYFNAKDNISNWIKFLAENGCSGQELESKNEWMVEVKEMMM